MLDGLGMDYRVPENENEKDRLEVEILLSERGEEGRTEDTTKMSGRGYEDRSTENVYASSVQMDRWGGMIHGWVL